MTATCMRAWCLAVTDKVEREKEVGPREILSGLGQQDSTHKVPHN